MIGKPMWFGKIVCCLCGVLMLSAASAAAQAPEVDTVRTAMRQATEYLRSIAEPGAGGYLWRYETDLSLVAGEVQATRTQIWIQPPGTPSVGQAFLTAYAATGDEIHREAAIDAAFALARGQLASGGWSYMIDFDPSQFAKAYRRTDIGQLSEAEIRKRNQVTTYDDDNTQSALRFLMDVVAVMGQPANKREREIQTALEYGLQQMLVAQYPIGAWPQRYDGRSYQPEDYPIKAASIPKNWARQQPKKHNYAGFYTLNDHTQSDCITTLLKAYRQFGREEYLHGALQGGEFLLLAQLPEPQPGWAQQYNYQMHPDWARAFEPPAVCSGESMGAVRTLMELYLETGDEKWLQPIPAVRAWLERSSIREGVWSRYYELGTNRPIYGDRDGKIYERLDQISEERQKGYSWEGPFGVEATFAQYDRLREQGRDKILRSREPRPLSEKSKQARLKSLTPEVSKLLTTQDDQGRWVRRSRYSTRGITFHSRIETADFTKNLRTMSEYVQLCE